MNGTIHNVVFMQLQVFCLEHSAGTNNIWRGFITPEFWFHIKFELCKWWIYNMILHQGFTNNV